MYNLKGCSADGNDVKMICQWFLYLWPGLSANHHSADMHYAYVLLFVGCCSRQSLSHETEGSVAQCTVFKELQVQCC